MDSDTNERVVNVEVPALLAEVVLDIASASHDEPYPHLGPALRADAALPDAKRIEILKCGDIIEHPAYRTAMDYGYWLLTQPQGVAPMGMLLTGEPGAGKSTFGEELVRMGEGRVLMIQAGGARNMRDIYGRVIQALDGPVSKTMHTPDRQNTVLRLFKAFDIKGLVVDEIQDLKRGTQREHEQVLTSLKTLMNEGRVALFCLGTPESDQALRVDKHLRARLRPFQFSPWRADQELVNLLGWLETHLPLRRSSALRNQDVLKYLVEFSGGSLREIMARITCASVRAILSGEERLDLDGLKAAAEPPPRPRGLEVTP